MPGLSIAFMIFLLSMAGIPPLAGFLGKFYLFFADIGAQPEAATWTDGYYWLVAFALVMSVVSLYYYLRVLKAFLVVTNEDNEAKPVAVGTTCLLYTSPSPRDKRQSRMPSSA